MLGPQTLPPPNTSPTATPFLSQDVRAMLSDRSIIRTVTYRTEINGLNIPRSVAIENSANWVEGEEAANNDDLDNLPTFDGCRVERVVARKVGALRLGR